MAADVRRDERTERPHLLALRADVFERALHELRADAVALELRLDLRVRHRDRVAVARVADQSRRLAVDRDLVGERVGMIDDVDQTCGMRASSAAVTASRTGASSMRSSTSWKKPRTISRSASWRVSPRLIK